MTANLALRFLLEVCVLIALAYWGIQTGKGLVLKLTLGIGAPVLIAIVWGIFGSPKAVISLNGTMRFLLELGIFTLAVLALYNTGQHLLTVVFSLFIILNQILLFVFNQH